MRSSGVGRRCGDRQPGRGVSALPEPVYSTFTFSGLCIDCTNDEGPSDAMGTLVLKDYAIGQVLQLSNFSKFTYSSQKISFEISSITAIYGSLTNVPGANDLGFQDSERYFLTENGEGSFWDTGTGDLPGRGTSHTNDFGFAAQWNAAAPEAATWAMMVAGFGVIGAAARRSRRTSISFG